jgi:RNA polymerase sigma-70 factor (ECF subfamily)
MSEGLITFRDLILRVRAGEEAAAAELVRRYEPSLRRAIRLRLRDPRLRRLLDTVDICQSVLADFFVRAALGRFELERPEQLLHLLAVMARHKLINQFHKQRAVRRDLRRVESAPAEDYALAAPDATPSQKVAGQELLHEARRRLAPDERQLLEFREQGWEWSQIAAELGGSPEALRKKLARAVERVAQSLGLAEVPNE